MKLLVVLAAVAAVASQEMTMSRFGVKYDEAISAISSITARLEALLNEQGSRATKNFLVSPLSMAVAVGELMLGARGALQEELYDLLVLEPKGYDSSVRHRKTDDYVHYTMHQQLGDLLQQLRSERTQDFALNTSSVLFQQYNLPLKQKFVDGIVNYYHATVRPLDFGRQPLAEAVVNKWAHDSTNGLISKLYPGGIPADSVAILANAVYFKADWDTPFSSVFNIDQPFSVGANESVNVTYMRGEFEDYRYVHDKTLGCKMVVVPYKGGMLNMYVILPDEDAGNEFDINKFSVRLTHDNITTLIRNARKRQVMLWLPKMQLSSTVNLLKPLEKYHKYKTLKVASNVVDIDEKIRSYNNVSLDNTERIDLDLGNFSEDKRFRLSSIYQQVTLNVNEKGTEAAAISAPLIYYMLGAAVVRVNRPFIFFIRHEETGAALFWGTIVNPIENF